MKVKKYSKLKMFGLYVLSVVTNILPLLVVIAINWEDCTKTTREGVAISVTGIVWVCFLVFTMLGSMPMILLGECSSLKFRKNLALRELH